MRTLIRPTGFVDSPFGQDGKVARLAFPFLRQGLCLVQGRVKLCGFAGRRNSVLEPSLTRHLPSRIEA